MVKFVLASVLHAVAVFLLLRALSPKLGETLWLLLEFQVTKIATGKLF